LELPEKIFRRLFLSRGSILFPVRGHVQLLLSEPPEVLKDALGLARADKWF
jgi:hypothetical protein